MIPVPALPRPEAVVAQVLPDGLPIVRDLIRAQLIEVFGRPVAVGTAVGDPGLFGPGSASWRLLADPASIVGGVRGLMLQTLHPGSMAGVHDHSAFATDPMGRLQRTTSWVIASALGSVDEVLRTARHVRAAHPHVRGTTPGGQPYAAEDPHLLAWVQCALTVSFLATDRAYAAKPLDQAGRDAFVREQSFAAALLDPRVELADLDHDELRMGRTSLPMIEDGTLPVTEAQLDATMAAFDWELEVNHQAREALAYLKAPPLPLPLRAGYTVVYLGAVATLTARQRRRMDLPMVVPGTVAKAAVRLNVTALRAAVGRSQAILDAEARAAA